MADVIDLSKKREEKEEEEYIDVYQCHCGSYFWLMTSEGTVCGFCESEFGVDPDEDEEE